MKTGSQGSGSLILFEQLLHELGVGWAPDVHFVVQARKLVVVKFDVLLLQLRFQSGDIFTGDRVFLTHDDGEITQLLIDRLRVF